MDEWKPVMAMLVFNLISAVLTALVKKALEQGLNALVLITLRQLVATLFLAPIAYFKERYVWYSPTDAATTRMYANNVLFLAVFSFFFNFLQEHKA
jgi:uncharacterized membrane protein